MTLAQVLRLPGIDLELEAFLRRLDDLTSRQYARCWLGNAKLAKAVNRSIRTVQLWLKRLEELVPGFRRVRNYRLNSRREILLPWRQERSLFSAELSATGCARVAPSSSPPPGPPLEEPEGAITTTDAAGQLTPGCTPAFAADCPSSNKGLAHPESVTEEASAIAEAAQVAAAVFREPPAAAAAKVASLAAQEGVPASVVARAVAVAAAAPTRPWSIWGYVRGIVRNWRAEGVPAAISAKPRFDLADLEADVDAFLDRERPRPLAEVVRLPSGRGGAP